MVKGVAIASAFESMAVSYKKTTDDGRWNERKEHEITGFDFKIIASAVGVLISTMERP